MMSLPGVLDPWRDVIHPAALILPRPNDAEYADLKASIETRGMLTPVATWVDASGEHWLLDGVSRLQVLVELDRKILDEEGRWALPTTPYYEDQGHDPYEIALSLNVVRRHLTQQQKREVIRQLREERPELSDRAIARMAGVSPHTVADERQAMEEEEVEAEIAETEAAEAASGEIVDPETGEVTERQAEAPITNGSDSEAPPAPRRTRREETGRRARGRQPQTPTERRRVHRAAEPIDPDTGPEQPFIGTVLASATKAQRVAEARRCLKHLRLKLDDLATRRRVAAESSGFAGRRFHWCWS
jgi:ParB-like chromosome segregation protein Spo0J